MAGCLGPLIATTTSDTDRVIVHFTVSSVLLLKVIRDVEKCVTLEMWKLYHKSGTKNSPSFIRCFTTMCATEHH